MHCSPAAEVPLLRLSEVSCPSAKLGKSAHTESHAVAGLFLVGKSVENTVAVSVKQRKE